MSDEYCPRLIEVALPIREISAESVRDKRTDQGNISSLHTWWARRPLAASRAVVFASLVPDPDHAACPKEFREVVARLLMSAVAPDLQFYMRGRTIVPDADPYRPYANVTDTLRNRLLAFIAKWSPEYMAFESGAATAEPSARLVLDDRCLVKWETSDPNNRQGREVLQLARELVRAAHPYGPPTVLDPFAGGGVIPLEVSRLECRAISNDYSPVAHIIQRATCEYPQVYGRRGEGMHLNRDELHESQQDLLPRRSAEPNVLIADLEYWAQQLLSSAQERVGHIYTPGRDGLPVLTYLWARTVRCVNPECRAQIPLIRSLLLRAMNPKVALTIDKDQATKTIRFGIAQGRAIRQIEGTKQKRKPAKCLFCSEPTSEDELRKAAIDDRMGERLIGVVVDRGGARHYRPVDDLDHAAFERATAAQPKGPMEYVVPEITSPSASASAGGHASIRVQLYGLTRWGQLFNARQLVAMNALVTSFHEIAQQLETAITDVDYRQALLTYLALWLDRLAAYGNTMCRWYPAREAVRTPFSGQSIPMMWDYPEVNPFSRSPSAGKEQLQRMIDVIRREQFTGSNFSRPKFLLGSATDLPLDDESCDCVVTDPPYGDAIAYADLSDFFYAWLKQTLGSVMPEVFSTPQTPKDEEATSHTHRHEGSRERAHIRYKDLLTRSFREALRVVRAPKLVSVMFAHQSTEAWSALLSALFDAGLCPDATWPIATEMPNAALGMGGANLESSVTVVCRPRAAAGTESFKEVKKEIEKAVEEAVHRFWSYGFRGADLIVASYGPAVGVFGKYEHVERADGTPVEVPELLDFARQAARDAIAGEFRGDNLSTLYYVWANLYGAAEQSWDDARLVVQVGGDAESAMDVARRYGIFVIDGAQCRLALLADRADRHALGGDPNTPLIDALHRAMLLWRSERRSVLVSYLAERGLLDEARFWKLAQALFEVLPRGSEDWKLVNALLGERDTLRTEAKRAAVAAKPQAEFDFDTTQVGSA